MCKFLPSLLRQLQIAKVCRRYLVVAIPNPNKPLKNGKRYHLIFLLCNPYKVFEKLIYTRIEPIIDPVLSREQACFRRGRSTEEQVALISREIENCFLAKKKACAVFVDRIVAYDTVCHRGFGPRQFVADDLMRTNLTQAN